MKKTKFITGITTGIAIGAAVSMMSTDMVDKKTKKRIRKSGKTIRNVADSMYSGMSSFMK
ncbi:Gas vesicle protein [Clostridium putrefaciens]|uniref:Gas vesicle protein n=1 Tax=Clostridium putrefaciens TaxID=99675 RepID=A0A381JBU6_9CLOT|nr:hypothetical protein [Clostridium putrefaciens]SUY47867.1 Gas vesicle protein [Clostridium putrefaciens]